MYIQMVRFTNFGPFVDYELKLAHGLIGFVGKNGAGKSTVLNGIYAALTNDFGRFHGAKIDSIHHAAGAKDESAITLEAEHNGQAFWLQRRLRPAGHELIVPGEKPHTGEANVRQRLEALLGTSTDMLDRFVFKRQNRIYDWLEARDSDRRQMFHVLCKTEVCEKLWGLYGDYLTRSAADAAVVDNSDELADRLAGVRGQVEAAEAEEAAARALLLNEKSLASAKAIVQAARDFERVAAAIVRVGAAAEAAAVDAGTIHDLFRHAQKRLAAAEAERDALAAPAERAKLALTQLARYENERRELRKLERVAAELRAEAEEHQEPIAPEGWRPTARVETLQAVQTRSDVLERAKAVVLAFEDDGVVACPTCGTPVESLDAHLQAQREIVRTYHPEIVRLKRLAASFLLYEQTKAQYETWIAGWAARHEANGVALKRLELSDRPEGERDELERAVLAYGDAEKQVKQVQKEVQGFEGNYRTALARAEADGRRLVELETEKEALGEKITKLDRAQERLAEHEAARLRVAAAERELQVLRQSETALVADLDRLRARLARSARVLKMREIVETAREVVHRTKLPGVVALENLEKIAGHVNQGLELFGDPFWVETDQNLTFLVHKPGEPAQAAGRLSGGQQTVLAIAFWLAVASLWGHDLGILALDEPTAALHHENRAYLIQVLSRLAAQVRGRRQVLLSTHAEELEPAFDQLVVVG